ncbi:replication-associated recombination protein A [Clostridium aestuarii]|uniref:Replication-associated recombination protein A n=1 Tax=Clostridium aestuarii TaxID=338193 RepID=A0ABT4CYK9_9CLOT|nr:replication-associated recombination protein A [Clostridium aestuarii]MCY6484051.1 replication-associated recombination protein A [Clostridium aestuarii]
MDLFDLAMSKNNNKKPLAEKMRPKNLNQIFGQKNIIGKGRLLRRLIENDNLTSLILFGPPGVGKTTLAHVISLETKCEFIKLNATSISVKEIRECIKKAEELLKFYGKKTMFFIDEIHALKKGTQQDALLDAVEKGGVVLIGATTENPYFHLNRALISRARIFKLEELKKNDVKDILINALTDAERGYGKLNINIDNDSIELMAKLSGGDARNALNSLELAVLSTTKNSDGVIVINKEGIKECIQNPVVSYDSSGDNHYDVISAFIKSIRGSDIDAALYWFGRMVVGGEDPRFIVRRLIVHASEDIGMKDPNAMLIVHAAWNALESVGMPEARIPIAQAIIYLAKANKSNSVLKAIDSAIEDAKYNQYRVPAHLRDTHYVGAEELGSRGYKNPHNYEEHYIEQKYFPREMDTKIYYRED